MSGQVIDRNVYDALVDTMGVDFLAEMVGAFIEEGEQFLADLRASLPAGDVERFRRAAHSMKSNAATFGAMELSALAKELEEMARAGSLDGAEEKLPSLAEAFARAEQALKDVQNG